MSVDVTVFSNDVYAVCRQIPQGRVTSYGHVAKLCGHPRHARLVGNCLKHLQDEIVPWHRVVNSKGVISPREAGILGVTRQATLLRAEGVEVIQGDVTEFGGDGGQVDMLLVCNSGKHGILMLQVRLVSQFSGSVANALNQYITLNTILEHDPLST